MGFLRGGYRFKKQKSGNKAEIYIPYPLQISQKYRVYCCHCCQQYCCFRNFDSNIKHECSNSFYHQTFRNNDVKIILIQNYIIGNQNVSVWLYFLAIKATNFQSNCTSIFRSPVVDKIMLPQETSSSFPEIKIHFTHSGPMIAKILQQTLKKMWKGKSWILFPTFSFNL